ncbi:chorismate mutase [Mucilaginibacter calamicampi]|uniref:chorismate mutase n=1 Tax=Mucilaginibacter calamicampi TaxID=1302352 RepID=A0ABW2YUC7_9SPHI
MKARLLSIAFGLLLSGAGVAYSQSAPPAAVDAALKVHRQKIDSLDDQLLKIIGLREQIVKVVGVYKAKNNVPPLQAARFQQVLEKNIALGKQMGLSAAFITELMNAIHKESLRIEEEVKTHK